MRDVPNDGSLSEEQAASILERATELDVKRGDAVDIADLRRAALDAGISQPSFDRALAELLSPEVRPSIEPATPTPAPESVPVEPGRPPRLRGWMRKAMLGVVGCAIAAFGFVFGSTATDQLIPLTVFWALLIVGGLVVSRRRDRSIIGFETDLLALCSGLTVGWMLVNPVDAAGIAVGVSFVGTIAALVGGLMVALARPREDPQLPAPRAIPPG